MTQLRLILDDDPTGTQTVADVQVVLRPSVEAFRRLLASGERTAFVLTNSRALPSSEAVALVGRIREDARKAAAETGHTVRFLLRGDSTLRGHVFAEMDALAESGSVALFVPAFPDGGRVTVGGVHYLQQSGRRVPVVATEFADDPVFGYHSERLVDWVAEVGDGRPAHSVPLKLLRSAGSAAVCDALINVPQGTVVVPDAETRSDIETIARGLVAAEGRGRAVVVRSAATFAGVWAGLYSRPLTVGDPELGVGGDFLLVCGSHTTASSRQLSEVLARWPQPPVVLDTMHVLGPGSAIEVKRAARLIDNELDSRGFAILASERTRRAEHRGIDDGASVMAGLVTTVASVAGRVDAVVAKGGITSAQVATDGFDADTARVVGQLMPGVPLWHIARPDGRRIPYAVVPGNVGDDRTLVNVVRLLGVPMP